MEAEKRADEQNQVFENKKQNKNLARVKDKLKAFKNWKLKKISLVILGVIVLTGLAWWLGPKIFKPAPKRIYNAAIMVRDQDNSNPEEDRRSSLKKGDVLITQADGHKWSKTENISYLILKMNLTEEQARKLTRPEERELKASELSEEERQRREQEEARAKEEDREYEPELRMEILRARRYYIDLAKQFPGFKALDLLKGQPFQTQVYDWGIVDKKPKVKD